MAFLAEVKAKLGIDSSEFAAGLTKAASDVKIIGNDISKKLSRSFGADDVFKGLLQGVGIGSVEQVVGLLTSSFSRAADEAKILSDQSENFRKITVLEISALGGQVAVIRERKREIKNTNDDIEIQKKLIQDLESSPLTFVSPSAQALLKTAKDDLAQLQVRTSQLSSEQRVQETLTRRRIENALIEEKVKSQLHALEMSNGSELQKVYLLQEAAFSKLQKLKDPKTGAGKEEILAAELVYKQSLRQEELIKKSNAEKLTDSKANLISAYKLAQAEIDGKSQIEIASLKIAEIERQTLELRKRGASDAQIIDQESKKLAVAQALNLQIQIQRKAADEIDRAANNEAKLVGIELRNGSEREKLLQKLNALREDEVRLKKEGATQDKLAQNTAAQRGVTGQISLLGKNASRQLTNAEVSIGASVANRSSSRRGPTETERLANRGERNRLRAEDEILKMNPGGASSFAELARRDLSSAGRRVAAGSAEISKGTSESLGSLLGQANKTLEGIKANLDPAKII